MVNPVMLPLNSVPDSISSPLTMTEAPDSPPHQGESASVASGLDGGGAGDSMEVECPICYQEYNQSNKCPRMLECLHVFCTDCLQRIQLYPCEPPDPHSPPAIPCPLCRHLTPLEGGNAFSLPCNSRILDRLPPMAFRFPVSMAAQLATVTQKVVLSLDGDSREARFIILPTVSLRVQQMDPERPPEAAPEVVGEDAVVQRHRKTLFCVQLLALTFWLMFVFACVVALVFGPHFFLGE